MIMIFFIHNKYIVYYYILNKEIVFVFNLNTIYNTLINIVTHIWILRSVFFIYTVPGSVILESYQ